MLTDQEKKELMDFAIQHCNAQERTKLIKICETLLHLHDVIMFSTDISRVARAKEQEVMYTEMKYAFLKQVKENHKHDEESVNQTVG